MLTQSLNIDSEMEFLSPLFIGAFGENKVALEKLLQEFTQEHNYWREDFQTENRLPITENMKQSEHYNRYIDKIRNELHSLTSRLKHELPIYNPHYVGHMASDLMLPAILAQLVTTFYNPNNRTAEASNVTMQMELDSGLQFAHMFGFNTNSERSPCAWGHLTTGGTNANHESLWNFRAVKYYPVALIEALKLMKLEIHLNDNTIKSPHQYNLWELTNLSIDDVLALRSNIFNHIKTQWGIENLKTYSRLVEDNRLETLGPAQFFATHWKLHQPVILVSSTAYAFWKKTLRLLGFGSASLIKVGVNQSMHMDTQELKRILGQLNAQNIPILAVIGVLGSYDLGTVDPIHSMIQLRKEFSNKGLNYYIHVDASYAGYLMTLFRNKSGEIISRESMLKDAKTFPSAHVYQAFCAISKVDSITIAPHTYGYIPQGIGGFISRNREIVKLLNHSESDLVENNDELDFTQPNRFILAGSRPGAKAAAVYVAHKVLPLTTDGFGRVIKQTIHASEYLVKKIELLKKKLSNLVHLSIPFKPDSNVIAITINPKNNDCLSTMNQFMMKVFKHLSHNQEKLIQDNEFLGAMASFKLNEFSDVEIDYFYRLLKLTNKQTLQSNKQEVIFLRHSLMNPWLLSQNNGSNYIDRYCHYLEKIILLLCK